MRFPLLITLLLLTNAATGELEAVSANGFFVVHETEVGAPREAVWAMAVDQIGQWWSNAHTISGDAGKLHIDARPLGCFCEDLGNGGGVVHLTVTFVNPGVLLRMTGGLGPLGLMGADGNMLWEFFDAEAGTRLRFTYAVGGFNPEGFDRIAGAVDAVIGDALARLRSFAETGEPEKREP